MTLLTVYTDGDAPEKVLESEEAENITIALKDIGVSFERWEVAEEFVDGGDQQAILERYREHIARVVEAEGYVLVDVAQLHRTDDEGWEELKTAARNKFLSEHTHDDDEVRFFVSGSGIFYLHTQGKVYAVLCEAGDLVIVGTVKKDNGRTYELFAHKSTIGAVAADDVPTQPATDGELSDE